MAEINKTGTREAVLVFELTNCTYRDKVCHWLVSNNAKRKKVWTLFDGHTEEEIREYCAAGSLVILEALDDADTCGGTVTTAADYWEEYRLWKIVKE